jgi:hypothetical protein
MHERPTVVPTLADSMLCPIYVGISLLACASVAQAGAPLVTDDASVIEAKSCQFEAWVNSARGARDYWAVPACNFSGNLELSLGMAGVNPAGEASSQQVVLQAKTVLARSDDGAWSVGAVGGVGRDNGPVQEGASSMAYYAKALLSLNPNEALEFDLNLGASNDFGAGTVLAAGAAMQYKFLPHTTALAEVFRNERGPGKYQVGLRYAFVPERFEAYASYGNRLGSAAGDSWWAVIGIRINTAPFLP